MTRFNFAKKHQGKGFRLEVGSVDPPVVDPSPPLVGESCTLSTAVLGFAAGVDVTFRVFEPHALHLDPVVELTGQTQEADRLVEVTWTFDWEAHRDQLSAARFVCVARCGDLAAISDPFEFKQRLGATIEDERGTPLPHVTVRLSPARGAPFEVETDEDGKIDALVPPGAYRIAAEL